MYGSHLFHTLLTHFFTMLFGDSVIALRLPNILASILILPLSYAVLRQGYGKTIALLATAFIAGSSALVEYSVNARGYQIQTLLMICLLGLGQYSLKNKKSNVFSWADYGLYLLHLDFGLCQRCFILMVDLQLGSC